LEELQSRIGPGTKSDAIIVLHGTDTLSDKLFRDCVERGCVKINVNSWARDPQVEFWQHNVEKLGLPDLYEGGMDKFAEACTRFFHLLGSANKAA
jgi:fructose-bisphosphate aldolase class II